MANGNTNGVTWKWLTGILVLIVLSAGGGLIASVNGRVDSVKADSSRAITHAEARIDANQADIIDLKGDVKLIKYQTQQILDILKEARDTL